MLEWVVGELDPKAVLGGRNTWSAQNRRILVTAILFGFFFLCRAGEYLRSGKPDYAKILRGADVGFRWEDGEDEVERRVRFSEGREERGRPDRVDVQFRKTKTDQQAFGCVRTHYRIDGQGRRLCVVRALHELRMTMPARFGDGAEANLPLFRWSEGGMVAREHVQLVLEEAARAVGLPPARFRSHSLRIGGASAMLHVTGQFDLVKRFGRWTSDAVHGYLHDSAQQAKGFAALMAADVSAVHYT